MSDLESDYEKEADATEARETAAESRGPRAPRTSFKVPAENIEALRDRVEELNRRVRRLRKRGYDVEEVQISVGALYPEKKLLSFAGGDRTVECVYADVELLSPKPPKVDGWAFIAALTHVDEVGTVLRVCPGAEVSEGELRRYRDASPENCDHCQTRRRRTDTFVIRDQGGNLRQVGRQCLRAYTGLENPEVLCACAEILFSVAEVLDDSEEEPDRYGGGGGRRSYASIAAYMPYVTCSIRTSGWLSRTAAREQGRVEQSTADLALSHGLFATEEMRARKEAYEPEERDYNLASAVVEFCEDYFAGCDVDKISDYENSLRVAMASGIVHPKLSGIVASSVQFYKRDLERRARNEAWAKMVECSRFQGAVKDRALFEELRVLSCREWQGDFGVTFFYSFVDEGGNAFAYFASRDMRLEPGQVVSLRATVKKHEVRTPKYDGAKSFQQTVLTRCSLVTRARVVGHEVVEEYLGKTVLANPDYLQKAESPRYDRVMERMNHYHLQGTDGRRFLFAVKARKKALVAGTTAVVSYEVEDLTGKSGERPVSLVAVL